MGWNCLHKKEQQPQLQQIPKRQTRNKLGVARYNAGLAVLRFLWLHLPPQWQKGGSGCCEEAVVRIRGSVWTLPSQRHSTQSETLSPSTAAQNGSAQHKISASFLKLPSFSGTIFWGLWFFSKVEFKEQNLGSLHHGYSNV